MSRADGIALAVFPLVIFGVLIWAGNLTTGPRMIDDNQIYRLQLDFAEGGFIRTFVQEQLGLWEMNRLVPIFVVQKVVQARLLGGNLLAWSVWTGIYSVLTASLLFVFLRLCGYSALEGLAFSLISVLGEQSVLWWRLLQGESIAMVFFSAALVAMALRIRTGKLIYEILFAVLATLAILSKESFILTVPAVLVLSVWLNCRRAGATPRSAVKASLVSMVWLSIVAAAALVTIKIGFGTTHFSYAGWAGLDAEKFQRIVGQYLAITNSWLLVPLLLIAALGYGAGRVFPRIPAAKTDQDRGCQEETRFCSGSVPGALAMAMLFWVLMTVPQLLLYAKSGFLGGGGAHFPRYILPCIFGFAFVIAELLRLMRIHSAGRTVWVVLAALCVLGSIIGKGATAYQEARGFAAVSRANDEWFESIAANTVEPDPIVLVYRNRVRGGGYSTQMALRVYYILSQRHGRGNLFYEPLPPWPTIEQTLVNARRQETRRHGRKMRTVEQLERRQDVEAVLIMNPRWSAPWSAPVGQLESAFLQRASWFDRTRFRRQVHDGGHISYFRRTPQTAAQTG